MSLGRKLVSGAGSLAAGQAIGQGLSFLRNIIIARLLGPEDFGIAMMLAVTMSMLEMISDLAMDKLIIQAPDGDDPALQATAQTLQFARGVAAALLLVIAAWPISILFGVPEARWAFFGLAAAPLVRGLMHLDFVRAQRSMSYLPFVAVLVVTQLVATGIAWPLAAWLGDYRAMLIIVIVQAAAFVVASHAVAERPYRWRFDRVIATRILDFGWPLLVNGLLMFGIVQGDRVIVGAAYPAEALGIYSVAFVLTMAPTMMLAQINRALALPALSRASDQAEVFEARLRICSQAVAGAALVTGAGFLLLGGWLVPLLYGEQYAGALLVLPWLAMMQAVRLCRAAPSVAAISLGDTRNPMIANLVRTLALPFAVAAAVMQLGLEWIAIAGLCGEVVGFLVSVVLLARRQHVRVREMAADTLLMAASLLGVTAALAWGSPTVAVALVLASAVAAGVRFEALRTAATGILRDLAGRGSVPPVETGTAQ